MARAMIYRGSSSLIAVDTPSDEVDPLELPIKNEPGSPIMESLLDFPEASYELPKSTSVTEVPESAAEQPTDPLETSAPPDNDDHDDDDDDDSSPASSNVHSTQLPNPQSTVIDLNNSKNNPKRQSFQCSQQLSQFVKDNCNKLKDSRLRSRSNASNNYECDICFSQFNHRGGLKIHMKYYGASNKHKHLVCHVCRKSVMTPLQLLSHRKSSHRHIVWPESAFKCDHCPLTFATKGSLQMHLFHYHDIGNNDKLKKRRIREISSSVLPVVENIQSESSRTRRKRRRDQMADERTRNVSKKSFSPTNNRPGPKFSKSHSLIHPSKPQNSTADTTPFVKIHTVPQEVEALLSDHDDSPMMKRKKFNDSQILQENIDSKCLRSGKIVKKRQSQRAREILQESEPKTVIEQKLITPLKRNSLILQSSKTTTRKITLLQMRYKCQECYVALNRIETSENIIYDDSETEQFSASNETINDERSIGVQLKNLEIALKKLEVPDSPSTENSSIKTEDTEVQNPINTKNTIYRSSICRTRFTTKQKLINHYLCFHTNASQDECGICKTRFGNIHKLKNHLLLHCVKIIQSKQDQSPIDSKAPCEKHRKKYLCQGCKKRFWLESCLLQHKEFCRFIQTEYYDRKIPQGENGEMVRRTSPRKFDSKTNNIQSATENKKIDPMDNMESQDSWSVNGKKYHDQLDRWWNDKVPHPTPAFPCSVCNINFQSVNTLAEHEKKFMQKDPKRCNQCGTLFPSKSLLVSHMKLTHSSESSMYKIRCPVCDQGFTGKKYIRSHLLHIHHDQINRDNINEWQQPNSGYEMKCKVCKLIFQNRKRFIEHSMYYFEDDTYNCRMCDKKFLGKFRCHYHWKTLHYSKEMQLAYTHYCPVCNEGFIFQSHLHSHMFHIHDLANDAGINGSHQANAQEPFVCSICEQRFSTILLLAHHQNLHSNDGKYHCDKCERKCRTISILNDHKKATHSTSHSDVASSKCPRCGEGISSKNLWIAHIKHVHEKPTDQPSEFCLENMCTLNELIRDLGQVNCVGIEEHSNSSNDTTGNCQVLFDEDDDLSIPEIQTANIEFNCAICDNKFTSMLELKNHKITHENISSKETDLITDNHTYHQMLPNINTPSLEMGHLPFISSQDSADAFYHRYHADKDLACNFSISNIYSVGLDEYEKLSNNQLQENHINHMTNTGINNNMEIETTENVFKCDICQLVFTCAKTLQNHQIRYSNTGDYICEVCGRRFKWLKVFRSHIRKHHKKKNDTSPLYYCEKCDEAFATRNSRLMHFAHIHNDPEMKSLIDNDVTIVDSKIVERESSLQINSTVTRNTISQAQSTRERQASIEEVDLTEDEEEEGSESPNSCLVSRNPLSLPLDGGVKPTVSQVSIRQTAYRPMEVVTNICPIVCNICRIQCINVDFLVKHFENAHSLRLTPYKITDNPNNTQYQENLMAGQSNYQQHNNETDADTPPLFYYCKTCRIQFANEYSLLTHLRNAHAKNDSVASKQDNNNWNSSDTISSGSDNRVINMMGSKVQAKSTVGGVSMETSFVNAESKSRSDIIGPDSAATDNAMDLTKKRAADNVVLSRIDLEAGPDRPYRILGGKDSQNIQLISLQKKDLVNLTRQRLQMNKSPEASNIR